MKLIRMPIAALVLSLFALPVLAQNHRAASEASIEQRQAEQKQLIEQGMASGKITPREAEMLNRGQERIENMESRARSNGRDGRMSRTDRNNIWLAQDLQASNIQRDTRNSEVVQTQGPSIDERQARQNARIDQGRAEGTITAQEAAKLHRGQAHVQDMERRAKADGRVTEAESSNIRAAQNQQSQAIRTAVRDNQFDR